MIRQTVLEPSVTAAPRGDVTYDANQMLLVHYARCADAAKDVTLAPSPFVGEV